MISCNSVKKSHATVESKSNYIEPYSPPASLSYSSQKKSDNTVTLSMSCSSDAIHDIILNNLKSSKIQLPPFSNKLNLECYSDDPPQLSDNVEDLFSICREPVPKKKKTSHEPRDTQPQTDTPLVKGKCDEVSQTLSDQATSKIHHESDEEQYRLEAYAEDEWAHSTEPTTSSGKKQKMVTSLI